jgi:HEAT repeat protein
MGEQADQRPDSGERFDPEQFTVALSSDEPTTRREAIDDFGALARIDPDAATDHVEAVIDCLTDESLVVARGAAEALVPIAREHPDALLDSLDAIVESLSADAIDLALVGAKLLTPLAVEYPEEIGTSADRLLEILVTDEIPTPETAVPATIERDEARKLVKSVQQEALERRQYVRRTAANVVVAVVEADPTAVTDIEALQTLLDDDDPGVVGPALDALGVIAESAPETVSPALDSILDCLDHSETVVRARAVRTLGYLGEEAAAPALRDVAVEDDDAEVSELAAETAAFLADE